VPLSNLTTTDLRSERGLAPSSCKIKKSKEIFYSKFQLFL
jgi:hypothetical protein